MKNTKYFKSEEEMNNYFPSGIPSNILAIVQGSADEAASLYTTSNNSPVSSNTMNMGGGGGVTPTGTLLVVAPGQYDVASYAYVTVCNDCTDNYSGLLDESVGSYVAMNHAQTSDNDEAIGTVDAAFAAEVGQGFNVDLTSYIGKNYVMFSDDIAAGEVYGILIDSNAAFTAAGYPSPESQTSNYLKFDMHGELKWKNASAGSGDVSSLVIGQASNIAVLNS